MPISKDPKPKRKYTKKSLPQMMTTVETFFNAPKTISRNPEQLLNLNKNWVYICNNKNAQVVASQPLRLYAAVNAKKTKDITCRFKTLDILRMKYIKEHVSHKYLNENTEYVEIIEHPFLDLIYNVNSILDNFTLWEITEGYMGILGNAYWYILKDRSGMPKEIQVLPSEYINVILDKDNNISRYEQLEPAQSKAIVYQPEDIIHFRQPVAGAFKRLIINDQALTGIYGMGHLESCIDEATLLDSINTYERSVAENRARPDFVIKYTNGKLEQKTQKELVRMWNRVFKGSQNGGKIQVMDQDFDIVTLGFAPKDLEFDKGKEYLKKVICDCFGVPVDLVDTNNSNRATAEVAEQQYAKYTILPKLRRYQETITQKLLPLYDENLFVMFDNPVKEDVIVQANELKTYVDAGIMSVNEARERMGLDNLGVEYDRPESKLGLNLGMGE